MGWLERVIDVFQGEGMHGVMDIKDAEIHAMVRELAMLTGCDFIWFKVGDLRDRL